jgi:hypothetical protein
MNYTILLAIIVVVVLLLLWKSRESYQHMDTSRMRWWAWWGEPTCGNGKCGSCCRAAII